ncbi:G patch domain and ankyrin repeat-containing protein 1 [Diretmus argenteus]
MASLGYFTPASEQDIFCNSTTDQSVPQTSSLLSGEEARRFYEGLTKDSDGDGVRRNRKSNRDAPLSRKERARRRTGGREMQQNPTDATVGRQVRREREDTQRREGTRERENSARSMELQGLKLLRCAQEGDLSGMKELLSRGVDINFQDSFFWTAVMCASWAGKRAAVRLLLQQGAAWVGVVDTQGRDARELALTAGHRGVLEELESFGRSTEQGGPQPHSSAPQSQWCHVCGSQYSDGLSSHLSSTLHQFSLRRPPPTPHYCLPPSSTGYKMMVRCGWNPGAGLGPEGAGPMQPVPTVLKRDQKGLGYGPLKRAKVTHFQAKDHEAVKRLPKEREGREGRGKGKRKEESRRQQEQDQNWERDFRASFYL